MSREGTGEIVKHLTRSGFNATREAAALLAGADDPSSAVEEVAAEIPPETLVVTAEMVNTVLDDRVSTGPTETAGPTASHSARTTASDGTQVTSDATQYRGSGNETEGSVKATTSPRLSVKADMTGSSTGTGEYDDFVRVFRDRLERLLPTLSGRVANRPASAIGQAAANADVAMVGLVDDIRSTVSGHWMIDLEDTSGVFTWLIMKDSDCASVVDELLCDEVIAVQGQLSDDRSIAFVDDVHFPEVPRTHQPTTADRPVEVALISDLHVGSQEFLRETWQSFTSWLHSEEATRVEYLLIAGDMVEGVGVYPDQDEELDIIDIYRQYERFTELLKDVPGDMEIVMIPGNHDAVRLAEPQPGLSEDLRDLLSVHDARMLSNPGSVTIDGVTVLMYHGVSLDEVIAEHPDLTYDNPQRAMMHLLKKRHLSPRFGGQTRLAPEERDYLLIDEIPDILHSGHVHKLGTGRYNGVLTVNSGCWQAQTAFQRRVDLSPDPGIAPIVSLDTLEVELRSFR